MDVQRVGTKEMLADGFIRSSVSNRTLHVSHNMLASQPVFRCTASHVPGQGVGGTCNVRSHHRSNVLDASNSFHVALVI